MTAPNIPPPASSAFDFDFHFLLSYRKGWEGETAFIVACSCAQRHERRASGEAVQGCVEVDSMRLSRLPGRAVR